MKVYTPSQTYVLNATFSRAEHEYVSYEYTAVINAQSVVTNL